MVGSAAISHLSAEPFITAKATALIDKVVEFLDAAHFDATPSNLEEANLRQILLDPTERLVSKLKAISIFSSTREFQVEAVESLTLIPMRESERANLYGTIVCLGKLAAAEEALRQLGHNALHKDTHSADVLMSAVPNPSGLEEMEGYNRALHARVLLLANHGAASNALGFLTARGCFEVLFPEGPDQKAKVEELFAGFSKVREEERSRCASVAQQVASRRVGQETLPLGEVTVFESAAVLGLSRLANHSPVAVGHLLDLSCSSNSLIANLAWSHAQNLSLHDFGKGMKELECKIRVVARSAQEEIAIQLLSCVEEVGGQSSVFTAKSFARLSTSEMVRKKALEVLGTLGASTKGRSIGSAGGALAELASDRAMPPHLAILAIDKLLASAIPEVMKAEYLAKALPAKNEDLRKKVITALAQVYKDTEVDKPGVTFQLRNIAAATDIKEATSLFVAAWKVSKVAALEFVVGKLSGGGARVRSAR